MKFTNPVIPGFAPDPSIVKVRDSFFIVNSSFHVFPGLPIYVSKNLQDWELKAHAICRPSQLDLSQAFTKLIPLPGGRAIHITGGLFAATIRYHKGIFYVICTNAYEDPHDHTHKFQNFYVSCPEEGIFSTTGWSDPIYFDFPGIDPSLFIDPDTNRAYVHGSYRAGPPWAPDCSIRQFEIELATGKPLTDIKFLWKGASTDAEGPHMYKKDDWYYLVTAEGSTFEGHEIDISRSRNIWGPYDGYPHNPLLTAKGRDTDIKWTGHGDFIQDEAANWFCVHLGIRYNSSNPNRHPLGRETFLTPMQWEKGEWPKITQTRMQFEVDVPGQFAQNLIPVDNRSENRNEDLYIRTPDLGRYMYDAENHTYSLQASPSALSTSLGTTTFVGLRQRQLVSQASTTLSLAQFDHINSEINAGLAVYKDDLRFALMAFRSKSRELLVEVKSVLDMKVEKRVLGTKNVPRHVNAIHLRVTADPDGYSFESKLGKSWEKMGRIDSSEMSGYDMTGTIFGICTTSTQESGKYDASGEWVAFEAFTVA
ncbi:murein transglycosylase [Penicillium waksmanii]|uniref:murein transglycosylase n=1 Tax=Penicillium waksmanii TaxID=69791 RepID=UPI00254911DE|nr:murein transglycosylase [Penicillium waksmanii]KAJ5974416.1 murein transglycosylase [Penicillium waksmanii]